MTPLVCPCHAYVAVAVSPVPFDSMCQLHTSTQEGRAAGGVINLTSKSGSNSLHGSAWEFNRLSDYTANTYDNAVQGIPKGKYKVTVRQADPFPMGSPIEWGAGKNKPIEREVKGGSEEIMIDVIKRPINSIPPSITQMRQAIAKSR